MGLSPKGDFTDKPFASIAPPTAGYRALLSGANVEREAKGPVIVAFGDSITDGVGSTMGANQRWPDLLAERLAARQRGPPAAVLNAGIGGNRVLSDGPAYAGQNALARFDRDVLSVPGVTHVVILEGINDIAIGGASPHSAESLIAGCRQMIDRAHAHGAKVIMATLTPAQGGARTFYPAAEEVRRKVNAWAAWDNPQRALERRRKPKTRPCSPRSRNASAVGPRAASRRRVSGAFPAPARLSDEPSSSGPEGGGGPHGVSRD